LASILLALILINEDWTMGFASKQEDDDEAREEGLQKQAEEQKEAQEKQEAAKTEDKK